MPLHFADSSIHLAALATVPERFLIFYSSEVDGQLWCGDCRRVDSLIKSTFSESQQEGLIVYVGDRTQWRAPGNPFRGEPWNITNVPTVIKLQEGQEVARLGDDTEILTKLSSFVKT